MEWDLTGCVGDILENAECVAVSRLECVCICRVWFGLFWCGLLIASKGSGGLVDTVCRRQSMEIEEGKIVGGGIVVGLIVGMGIVTLELLFRFNDGITEGCMA